MYSMESGTPRSIRRPKPTETETEKGVIEIQDYANTRNHDKERIKRGS